MADGGVRASRTGLRRLKTPPDDLKGLADRILLYGAVLREQAANLHRDAVNSFFKFWNKLGSRSWIVGQVNGMASELRKQSDIAGRHEIGALNALIGRLNFIAEECREDFGRTFPS